MKPVQVLFYHGKPPAPQEGVVMVPLTDSVSRLPVGSLLMVQDICCRTKEKELTVVAWHPSEVLVQSTKTIHFATGAIMRTKNKKVWNTVGRLPDVEETFAIKEGLRTTVPSARIPLTVAAGELLLVTRDEKPGGPGAPGQLPRISVLPGWLLTHVKIGEVRTGRVDLSPLLMPLCTVDQAGRRQDRKHRGERHRGWPGVPSAARGQSRGLAESGSGGQLPRFAPAAVGH